MTRNDGRALAGLFLLAALALGPLWLHPDGLIYPPASPYSDLTITFWPNVLFNLRSLRQFAQLPLWRPWIMSGTPYLGNPQSGLFYPPNLVFLLLPITVGFNLLAFLHLAWTGWGMYRLQRLGFDLAPWPAFLSAVAWMLTPKLMAHLGAGHVGMVYAVAWWPWVVGEGTLAWRRRSPARAALSGAAMAMQMLTHPQIAALTTGTLAATLLYLAWRERTAIPLRVFWPWLPTALLLAAPLWWPLLRLLPHLTRGGAATAYALGPGRALLGLLLGQRGGHHEATVYLGLLPLWLASLAWREERGRTGLALILALTGGGMSLGGAVVSWMAPLMRVPARTWFMVAFAGALLAGWGAASLSAATPVREPQRWTRVVVAFGWTGALLGGGVALILPPLRSAGFGLAAFALLDAAWLLAAIHRRMPARWMWTVAAFLLLADLAAVDFTLWRALPLEAAFEPGQEVVTLLAGATGVGRDPAPARVYSPSYSIPQHLGALYGLHQVDGVDPIQLAHYRRFMALAGGYDDPGYTVTIPAFPQGEDVRTALREARPRAELLGVLNCRYVVSAFPLEVEGLRLWRQVGEQWIYENQRLLPRAWVTRRVEVVQDPEEALARLTAGFDVTAGALVETGEALDGPPGYRPARVVVYTPNQVEVEVEAEGRSLLVLSEVWGPGWKAWVDGLETRVYRVDGVVRGVYLGEGRHRVVMRAQPFGW